MTREEWDGATEDVAFAFGSSPAPEIGPGHEAVAASGTGEPAVADDITGTDPAAAADGLAEETSTVEPPPNAEPAPDASASDAGLVGPDEAVDATPVAETAEAAPEGGTEAGDDATPVAPGGLPLAAAVLPSLAGQAAAWWPTIFGFSLSVLVVIAMARLGFVDDAERVLQVAGFGPDRAVLLTALLMGAIGAAVVAGAGGRFGIAAATGTGVVLLTFYQVFRQETREAMRAAGPDGTFDPVGWGLSALTLITVALVLGWAAAVLGRDVAARLEMLRGAVVEIAGRRGRDVRAAARIAAAAVVVGLLAVTLPVFWDMLTIGPAVHMRQGGPPAWALDVTNPSPAPAGLAASPAPGASRPAILVARLVPAEAGGPGASATEGALGSGRPWASNPPAGSGRIVAANLPAPWVGGLLDHATIEIYLPPGYDASTQRYPVIYEAPHPLSTWEQQVRMSTLLDDLIGKGIIPAGIVVFADQYGGPFADSECADSYDGREWFDRYLAFEVPAYVDATFRTIPTAAARSLMGFSPGGYCAAAVLARHPDVFGSALVFNGSFDARSRTTTTPSAGRPFNGDPALESAASPVAVLPGLPASVRAGLFFVLATDASNRAALDQVRAFKSLLESSGAPFAVLPSPNGLSWVAVRKQLPGALGLLAARQVGLGVFAAP